MDDSELFVKPDTTVEASPKGEGRRYNCEQYASIKSRKMSLGFDILPRAPSVGVVEK